MESTLPSPETDVRYWKRCTKCGELREGEAFARKKNAPDGRQWVCRRCQKTARRESYDRAMAGDERTPEFVECLVCGDPAPCGLDNPYWLNQFGDGLARNLALCCEGCHEVIIDAFVRMENLLSLGAKNDE